MAIFKRKTSAGWTREYHYKFMQSGQWFHGVCEGCTSEREALAYEKRIKETVKKARSQESVVALVENFRKELTGSKTITLNDAFSLYKGKPKKRTASKKQTERNHTYWNDFLAFMGHAYPMVVNLANVTSEHAGAYISHLRTTGAYNKKVEFSRSDHEGKMAYVVKDEKLSPRTVNARHKAIKAVFTWLADDAGLITNPFDIPTLDNDTVSRGAFTDAELKAIGQAMTMPYIRPIFTIGLCTGLTLGDICMLRWDEVNGNWISNKRRRKTGAFLDIPIMPPLAAFLSEQRSRTGGNEYVSPELAEMYIDNPSGVFYRVREFLESLNISTSKPVEGRSRAVSIKSAHAMRHTFAYLAGVYNVPLPIVQSILGHMSPEMTKYYQTHASRVDKERFLKTLPDFLGRSTPSALLPPPENKIRKELDRRLAKLSGTQIAKVLDFIETL